MRPKNYHPIVCAVFLLVCVGMMVVEIWQNDWAFESFSVNPTFGPSPDVLIQLGAKETDLILDGDYYRLFAPMILHAGVIHCAFNMFGLFQVGFPAEREFGHFKIGAILLMSGFVGVLASCLFVPELIGVGASGAIFGLLGACWADLLQNWSLYQNQACCTLIQLLVSTLINLLPGLMPLVDNFAHLGGFATGFVLGLTLLVQTRYTAEGRRKQRKDYQVCLQGFAMLLLPVMIGVGTLMLFLRVDAHEWCSWCHFISCVPMPPGADADSQWWDCSACSGAAIAGWDYGNGTWAVTCPSGNNVSFPAYDDLYQAEDLLAACKGLC